MGLVRTKITLRNPSKPHVKALEVEALADTGATHMCVPSWMAAELELEEMDRRPITLADGRRGTAPYAGPLLTGFRDRACFAGAVVMGDEVLLGAIAMEDMDLVVSPLRQTVEFHPLSADGPRARV